MSAAIPSGSERAPPSGPSDLRDEGAGGSIAASAIRASIWVVAGYGSGQLLRFVGNVILARLLFPDVFGLASLVFVFLTGLQMFSDVGSGPAIVQSARGDDPGFLNTAWTISCVRGVVLWGGACVLAHPLASFYGQPLLAQIMPVAGLQAALGGFEATSLHEAQRHLRAQAVTFVELAAQAATIASSIVLALIWRPLHPGNDLGSVWAVIWGVLIGSVTRLVLSHVAVRGTRNRLHLEREAASQLLGFGRWVFLSSMLTFLAAQSDRLLLGKMIPLELLGVYGIAINLALLATQAVQKVGGLVLFPAYSRLAAKGELPQAFPRARLPLLVGGALVVSGFVACGPSLIQLLYDSRYVQAGWMLQVLAATAWFQVLDATYTAGLLAQRRLKWMTASSAAKLIGLIVLLPLGMHLDGFRGALLGLVLSDVVKYLISTIGASLGGLKGIGQDLLQSGLILATSCAGILVVGALERTFHARVAAFLGAGLVITSAWAVVALVLLRRRGPVRPGAEWTTSVPP